MTQTSKNIKIARHFAGYLKRYLDQGYNITDKAVYNTAKNQMIRNLNTRGVSIELLTQTYSSKGTFHGISRWEFAKAFEILGFGKPSGILSFKQTAITEKAQLGETAA